MSQHLIPYKKNVACFVVQKNLTGMKAMIVRLSQWRASVLLRQFRTDLGKAPLKIL